MSIALPFPLAAFNDDFLSETMSSSSDKNERSISSISFFGRDPREGGMFGMQSTSTGAQRCVSADLQSSTPVDDQSERSPMCAIAVALAAGSLKSVSLMSTQYEAKQMTLRFFAVSVGLRCDETQRTRRHGAR